LPFASGVYTPVGFITGRFGPEHLLQGFLSITGGLLFFGLIAMLLWRQGLRRYSGQGA